MLPATAREAARRFGDRPAIVFRDERTVTYAELDQSSEGFAAELGRRGVGEGAVVALDLPSEPDYVIAYLACAKLGAACAGINPRYTSREREAVLGVLQPDLVVDEVAPSGYGRPPALREDPDRVVAVVFTSGTTGLPKGAVFTNRQLEAISRMDAGTGWGGGGPMLSSTELCHVGFMTKLPWYLRTGMTIHLLGRWRASDALDVIERQRIRSIGGIGAQIALMLREPGFDDRDWSAVETIVTGGGPTSPELIVEARERFGAALSVRYSSTESGGLGTMTAFDAPDEEALRTVGRPRPGIDLEIREPSDGVGEVWLRSPSQMTGYWRNPEATEGALRDGWLRTGDLGSLDDRGCLRLVGRGGEMYVRGGYNVYPMEVERVLSAHPKVAEVVVVPRPDDVMGSVGVAVVVPAGEPPSLDELRAYGEARLARYKLPEEIRVVEAVPLTPMHKVDRARLIERLREG